MDMNGFCNYAYTDKFGRIGKEGPRKNEEAEARVGGWVGSSRVKKAARARGGKRQRNGYVGGDEVRDGKVRFPVEVWMGVCVPVGRRRGMVPPGEATSKRRVVTKWGLGKGMCECKWVCR